MSELNNYSSTYNRFFGEDECLSSVRTYKYDFVKSYFQDSKKHVSVKAFINEMEQ